MCSFLSILSLLFSLPSMVFLSSQRSLFFTTGQGDNIYFNLQDEAKHVTDWQLSQHCHNKECFLVYFSHEYSSHIRTGLCYMIIMCQGLAKYFVYINLY